GEKGDVVAGSSNNRLGRLWPALALLVVGASLFACRIDLEKARFNQTDHVYACANTLLVLSGTPERGCSYTATPFGNPIPRRMTIVQTFIAGERRDTCVLTVIPIWPYQAALAVVAIGILIRRKMASRKTLRK
ncbi:MAG: hypothetical protein KDA33_02145, partial [Phycisphaerales bacterium]|nr:hypothetical protein [Phycisphaerales bacterium]